MKGRALFAASLATIALVGIIVLVLVPGVQRGGWFEIGLVVLAIAAIALLDRWFRRLSRRR